MRKPVVILLAVMLMAAVGLAQTAVDPLLGSHNVNGAGCLSCHTPHNALPGKGAYLWAGAIPTGSYTTYLTSDGNGGPGGVQASLMETVSGSALANAMSGALANLPMAHTVLCLSCHDTAFNTAMAANIPTSTTIGSQFNIGTGGNLSGDHPVNVLYPATDPMYFQATINAGTYTVSFTDTAYAYGHPTKLYTDGTNIYVECSTCHNPHNQTAAVVPVPGTTGNVLQAACTTHFIRGQYRSTNEAATGAATVPCTTSSTTYKTDNANFCMSCHAYPTAQFNGMTNP